MTTKPLYKEYHRNYASIEELYDDLRDVLLHVSLENGRIAIPYGKDVWQIELGRGGFITYLNGKEEKEIWEDQDIYYGALEFAHEQLCGCSEIQIVDLQIATVGEDGLTYIDALGRSHSVNFSDCAREFSASHPEAQRCIGEQSLTKFCFTLYTPGVKTVIRCAGLWRLARRGRLLSGRKATRFRALQKLIGDLHYCTVDCE